MRRGCRCTVRCTVRCGSWVPVCGPVRGQCGVVAGARSSAGVGGSRCAIRRGTGVLTVRGSTWVRRVVGRGLGVVHWCGGRCAVRCGGRCLWEVGGCGPTRGVKGRSVREPVREVQGGGWCTVRCRGSGAVVRRGRVGARCPGSCGQWTGPVSGERRDLRCRWGRKERTSCRLDETFTPQCGSDRRALVDPTRPLTGPLCLLVP